MAQAELVVLVGLGLEVGVQAPPGHLEAHVGRSRIDLDHLLEELHRGRCLQGLRELDEEGLTGGSPVHGLVGRVIGAGAGDGEGDVAGPEGLDAEGRPGLEDVVRHGAGGAPVQGELDGHSDGLAVAHRPVQGETVGGLGLGRAAVELLDGEVALGKALSLLAVQAGQVAHLKKYHLGQANRVHRHGHGHAQLLEGAQVGRAGLGTQGTGRGHQGGQAPPPLRALEAEAAQGRPGISRKELEGARVQPAVLAGMARLYGQEDRGVVSGSALGRATVAREDNRDRVVLAQIALGQETVALARLGGQGGQGR